MQGKMALCALVAAFCAGALADRMHVFAPVESEPASRLETVAIQQGPTQNDVADSEPLTMQNCLISANRAGMTREQKLYACEEIVN